MIVSQFASVADLQRRFEIGHQRASAVMADLEENGIVGSDRGPGRTRDVLITTGTVAQRDAVIDAAFPRPTPEESP